MLTDQAREARKAYKREWNRKNADKVKAAQERYWNKKAAKLLKESDKPENEQGA